MSQGYTGWKCSYGIVRSRGNGTAFSRVSPERISVRSYLDRRERKRLRTISPAFYTVKASPLKCYLQLADGILPLEYLIRITPLHERKCGENGDDNYYDQHLDNRDAFLGF
jgi:hypothetical protein